MPSPEQHVFSLQRIVRAASRGVVVLIVATQVLVSAQDSPPLPPLLSGEILTHATQSIRGQIAPPVSVGDGSAILFTESEGALELWRVFPAEPQRSFVSKIAAIKIPFGPRLGYSAPAAARHASVASTAGLWLIGPAAQLIRPNGEVLVGKLQWPRSNPNAVALPDGSVMVIGGYSWPESRDFSTTVKVERVWMTPRGQLQSEALTPLPVDVSGTGVWDSFYGYSTLHIGNGKVMVSGSEYRQFTLMYDPARKNWRKLGGFKIPRDTPALVLLPEGQVWATGGGGNSESQAPTTTEIWSPSTQQWRPGPDLPAPMVGHRAIVLSTAPGTGAVVLAGGYFPTVLTWQPGEPLVWIAAQPSLQRLGSALVVLNDQRLAMVSGTHARIDFDEAYGRRSDGVAVIQLDMARQGQRQSTWPTLERAGMAENKGQLVMAGGVLSHSYGGSVQKLPSRLLERMDLASGRTYTLPPLPVDAAQAQLAWLKDTDFLVHAERTYGRDAQWLGVVDVTRGTVRPLKLPEQGTYMMSDGIHNRMRLIGALAGRAWLVGENARVYWIDPVEDRIQSAPRLQRQRQDFTGRVLADGRVVVAGGTVEGELVAARAQDCDSCPVKYIGYGPNLPSRRHEIYSPSTSSWESSTPSRAAGGNVAILANGSVVKAGVLTEQIKNPADIKQPLVKQRTLLEISDAAGSKWRTLEWPDALKVDETFDPKVLVPLNNLPEAGRTLFIGVRLASGASQWYWTNNVDIRPVPWRELGVSINPYGFPPGELYSGLSTADGKRLFFRGGHEGVAAYAKPQ